MNFLPHADEILGRLQSALGAETEELAVALGVETRRFAHWRSVGIPVEMVVAVASAGDVSLDWLILGRGGPTAPDTLRAIGDRIREDIAREKAAVRDHFRRIGRERDCSGPADGVEPSDGPWRGTSPSDVADALRELAAALQEDNGGFARDLNRRLSQKSRSEAGSGGRRELTDWREIRAVALQILPALNGLSVGQALAVLKECRRLVETGTVFDATSPALSALPSELGGHRHASDE